MSSSMSSKPVLGFGRLSASIWPWVFGAGFGVIYPVLRLPPSRPPCGLARRLRGGFALFAFLAGFEETDSDFVVAVADVDTGRVERAFHQHEHPVIAFQDDADIFVSALLVAVGVGILADFYRAVVNFLRHLGFFREG